LGTRLSTGIPCELVPIGCTSTLTLGWYALVRPKIEGIKEARPLPKSVSRIAFINTSLLVSFVTPLPCQFA